MATLQTSRLLKIVAGPGLLFAWLSAALGFAILPLVKGAAPLHGTGLAAGLAAVIVLPDALATWWLFRMLRLYRMVPDARRGATAFAFTAPIVLSVSYLLSELVGGWTEVLLGGAFILPAIFVFISMLVATIPGLIVKWALHSSGGATPLNEGPR